MARRDLDRLTDLLMDVNDVLICLRDNGEITHIFGKVQELLGQPPDSFIGRDINTVITDDILIRYFRDPSKKIFHSHVFTPDRQRVPVSLSIHRDDLVSEDGGFLLTLRDLTEKLRLQESLKRLAALEYEKKRADQSEHIFSELIHNMKNRLVVIAGFAKITARYTAALEVLRDGWSEAERSRSGLALDKVKRTTEQIFSQARDTLELVEMINKKTYCEREHALQPINLNELLQTELQIITMGTKVQGLERVLNLTEQLPPITGIYSDFSQVFVNLFKNAVEAMHDSATKKLHITTYSEKGYNIVDISDTGYGVPEELREKIFEPFFTTKPVKGQSATDQPTGTGLGLSSTRRILGGYAGEITCTSPPAGGAFFRVRIPYPREIHKKMAGLEQEALAVELEKIMYGLDCLPTVPDILVRIWTAIKEQKDSKAIAEVMATDYFLLGKVLQVVNSAYFGLRRRITKCEEAIVLLGTREVQNLAQTIILFQALFQGLRPPSLERLWHHSMGTALIADGLILRARQQGHAYELAGAYLTALLHDVGEIIFAQGFPADHRMEANVLTDKKGIIGETDKAMILHPEIGYVFLKMRTDLGEELLRPIQLHHTLPTKKDTLLQKVLFLADKIERYYPDMNAAGQEMIQEMAREFLAIDPLEVENVRVAAGKKRDFLASELDMPLA